MLIITRFLVAGFLILTLQISFANAQLPTTESDAELRIKNLEKQADSLKKEAKHLKDSLHAKFRHKDFGNLFLNSDSLLSQGFGNIHSWDSLLSPGVIQDWMKDYHFEVPEIPKHNLESLPHWKLDPFSAPNWKFDPFDLPKEEKKKSPVPGFNGWYIEQLAEL